MIQAVILAGGLGTRLQPATTTIPKAMIYVGSKPFLQYQIELLATEGIADVIICIGYLGDQIKDYFGNGKGWGIRIRYGDREREELLGTGGTLKAVENMLEDYFFVLNGDTYLPIDYSDMERCFIDSNKSGLVAIESFEDAAGVYIFSKESLKYIKDAPVSLEAGLIEPLKRDNKLLYYCVDHDYYDIGTPSGLEAFKDYMAVKG